MVVFDVWSRQRQFISYHPRTMEWLVTTISPHMTAEYQNFFLSLSERHLRDRYSIELMFKYHYPECARVFSNSNGLRAIDNDWDNVILFMSRVLRKIDLNNVLPIKYRNVPIDFSSPAVQYSKKESYYPIFYLKSEGADYFKSFIEDSLLEGLYDRSMKGDVDSYEKLLSVQTYAQALHMLTEGKLGQ
jgi:hypothetical protein